MPRAQSFLTILLAALASGTGCDRNVAPDHLGPSPLPALFSAPLLAPHTTHRQGSVALAAFHFAVVSFRVEIGGTVTSHVDWINPHNDIDTALLRGRCTVDQILAESSECDETRLIVSDESFERPSVLSPVLDVGDYTLVVLNVGAGTDTITFRLDGFVADVTNPTTSPVEGPAPSPTPVPTPTPTPSPSPSPTPTPTPSATCPTLLRPTADAVLDNGRQDARDSIVWEFDWSDCPQATAYHLYVIGPNARVPIVNQSNLTQSAYRHVRCGSYVADANRSNWTWRVRARIGTTWSEWTAFRRFHVEPIDADPAVDCR